MTRPNRRCLLFECIFWSVVGLSPSLLHAAPATGSAMTISGIVKDNSGKPLRGARVTVTAGNKSVSRFANAAGKYAVSGLADGTYNVAASAWGFEERTAQRSCRHPPNSTSL